MRKCIGAILLSILFHALLALGLIAYLDYAPQPDVLATLDLSSVELSFAEEVRETAAVAPSPPAAAADFRPPKPKVDGSPPEAEPVKSQPPDPLAYKFPEPKEVAKLAEKVRSRKADDAERKPSPQPDRSSERAERPNSPPPAPRQARLDAPPRPKRNIRPDYPKGARQRGEQGEVVLEIHVGADGTVDDVKVAVSSGFPDLDAAAVKAAKAAKFSPARSGRESVASSARLKLQFRLK